MNNVILNSIAREVLKEFKKEYKFDMPLEPKKKFKGDKKIKAKPKKVVKNKKTPGTPLVVAREKKKENAIRQNNELEKSYMEQAPEGGYNVVICTLTGSYEGKKYWEYNKEKQDSRMMYQDQAERVVIESVKKAIKKENLTIYSIESRYL